nr:GGDEF domain-containing protein [Bacilli bacterium]
MKKKVVIIIISLVVVLAILGGFLYFTSEDKITSLNAIEKKWIDSNKKTLQDISIYTDIPVFSYNSEGIIFDYLNNLENSTGLEFNKVPYKIGDTIKTDYAFEQKDTLDNDDILMYTDNYVLVTKTNKVYNNPSEMKNFTVGILNDTLDKVNGYLLGADVSYKTFNDYNAMMQSLGVDVDSVVIPRIRFLANVVDNDSLNISYNITEYKIYYVLNLGSNNTLNNILTKYYKKWSNDNYDKSFNTNLLNSYFAVSEDASKNIARLRSKRYIYGFVNNAPYDILSDGELVGINNEIISNFSKVSGITIEYKEFNNVDSLVEAFNSNKIDFYFDSSKEYTYDLDINKSVSPFSESIVILTSNKSNIIVNSINSLSDTKVGVLKNSKISNYLTEHNIPVKEYDSVKKLMNDKKVSVKAIDNYNYEYYINKGIKNYRKNYEVTFSGDYTYVFRSITDNKDFYNFFNFYLTFVGTKSLINTGINAAINNTMIFVTLRYVAYVLGALLIASLIALVVYKIKHRQAKKSNLTKEEKLKYIDMLTSLKNRNYLNDNIELWDNSEVYPQSIVMVDLNNLAYINDNYGHAEGDEVIKEAANILIRTQIPNSEIIRTNGNEFLIYLVSYDEKQVIAYIRKIAKELKDVAHGFGSAIGYSMITDAIKTIDDAINEATLDMKNNKEELSKD